MIEAVPTAASEIGALAGEERRRGLEMSWLATFVVAFVVICLSWLAGALDHDISQVLWTVFGCVVGGLALDAALERVQSRYPGGAIFECGHASKVVGLAVLWHMMGGIDNPGFLAVFFLPVLAAGVLLMRRQALIVAGLTAATVTFVALCESSELRGYVAQTGLRGEPLLSWLPSLTGHAARSTGLESRPAAQFVALLMFTSLLAAAVLLTCLLARRTLALFERFLTASYAMDDSNDLVRSALREDPQPTVVVYADSGQIVEVSRGFLNQMLLGRAALPGTTLFDCLSFSEPRAIRDLLSRPAGELRFARYRVGKEPRTAAVRCHRFRIGRVDYASLTLTDRDELSYLWDACHEIEYPFVVVRNDRDVVYFNAAAQRICAGLHFGMDATRFTQALTDWPETFRVRRLDVGQDPSERLLLVGLFSNTAFEAFDVQRATA